MKKYFFKLLCYISSGTRKVLIASLFLSSFANAEILILGGETPISNGIKNHFDNKIILFGEETVPIYEHLVYANFGLMSDDDLLKLKQKITNKNLVVLDFNHIQNPENIEKYTKDLTGLGLSSKYIVVGELNGDYIFNVILTEDKNSKMTTKQVDKNTVNSFVYVLNRFGYGVKS